MIVVVSKRRNRQWGCVAHCVVVVRAAGTAYCALLLSEEEEEDDTSSYCGGTLVRLARQRANNMLLPAVCWSATTHFFVHHPSLPGGGWLLLPQPCLLRRKLSSTPAPRWADQNMHRSARRPKQSGRSVCEGRRFQPETTSTRKQAAV